MNWGAVTRAAGLPRAAEVGAAAAGGCRGAHSWRGYSRSEHCLEDTEKN